MKKFQDFIDEQIELSEVDSMSTRLKKRAAFRKNKAKILRARKKKAKKPQLKLPQLQKKANKKARMILIKKIIKDKKYADLSIGHKKDIEKKLEKKKNVIAKLSKKLLPKIRSAELEKVKKKAIKKGADTVG